MRWILERLRKLQNEKRWAVIILSYGTVGIPTVWPPLHQYIQTHELPGGTVEDSTLKDFMDVIRNPNFNRYERTYRWALARNDFFNSSCLKQINKIHILIYLWNDVYLSMVLAILRKENTRREQEKQEPLKVVFYYLKGNSFYNRFKLEPGVKYIETGDHWRDHPLLEKSHYTRNKEDVFIHFMDGWFYWLYGDLSSCKDLYRLLLQNQQYHYRAFRSESTDYCYNEGSIKTFGSIEELFDLINHDLCSSNK